MALVRLREVLAIADEGGYAVGAVNIFNLESALAVAGAAEDLRIPVILQIYRRLLDNGLAPGLVALARRVAADAAVPVCVHLDHGSSVDQVRQAVALGFTSAMLDGSNLDYDGNAALTREAVAIARAAGLDSEGELGMVPAPGAHHDAEPDELTDPDAARRFVADTGVDALAIGIGNAHGFHARRPQLDFARAAAVAEAVPVPIVLHGGSDLTDDDYRRVIRCGVRKINLATEFQAQYIELLTQLLNQPREGFKPADVVLAPATAQLREWLRARLEVFCHV